jgi:DNA-directed RNA polymerase subunit RPC12/RpoP
MSEFTYACPVCGQHIKCDMSQSGTTMECPTCFQKIVAPDVSPLHDPKFVITGIKVAGERPVAKLPADRPAPVPHKIESSLAAVVVVVILLGLIGAGAVLVVWGGKSFKSTGGPAATNRAANQTPGEKQTPAKPAVVAPPANDANWKLTLDAATIPNSTAVGRVHGLDFICGRVFLQGGTLVLRAGTRGPPDFGLVINFNGAPAEALAGQTINVVTNADKAARVTLLWREDDQTRSEHFTNSYAMRLEFGALVNNHLPGKIYFCAPDDEKSYVVGNFNAEIRKPKPPKQ